jgi:hypothetical protein
MSQKEPAKAAAVGSCGRRPHVPWGAAAAAPMCRGELRPPPPCAVGSCGRRPHVLCRCVPSCPDHSCACALACLQQRIACRTHAPRPRAQTTPVLSLRTLRTLRGSFGHRACTFPPSSSFHLASYAGYGTQSAVLRAAWMPCKSLKATTAVPPSAAWRRDRPSHPSPPGARGMALTPQWDWVWCTLRRWRATRLPRQQPHTTKCQPMKQGRAHRKVR